MMNLCYQMLQQQSLHQLETVLTMVLIIIHLRNLQVCRYVDKLSFRQLRPIPDSHNTEIFAPGFQHQTGNIQWTTLS